jgi:hypothetical protein
MDILTAIIQHRIKASNLQIVMMAETHPMGTINSRCSRYIQPNPDNLPREVSSVTMQIVMDIHSHLNLSRGYTKRIITICEG